MNDRISLVLRTKNITPSQLADEIGVQRSGVSHILNGRNKPSLDFIQKLLKRYPDISMAWLMFGEGAMMNPYPGVVSTKQSITKPPIMDLFQISDQSDDEGIKGDENDEMADDESEFPIEEDIQPSEGVVSKDEDNTPYNRSGLRAERKETYLPGMEKINPEARLKHVNTPGNDTKNKETAAIVNIPVDKNITDTSARPVSNNRIAGIPGKEITRIVIFYNDRSFTEYYPGNE